MTYVLYTMPGSLYSAKARSYMRKNRVEHDERAAGDPRFLEQVVPKLGRWIIPVLVTPDGELVQDSLAILDHFEGEGGTAYPLTPMQRTVAHVLELFAGEGLLRPAMHYRWGFDEDNLGFLERDFVGCLAPGADATTSAEVFKTASERMRTAAVAFGVRPATVADIESSYLRFLSLLSAHLEDHPYLLGGVPTIADYALMGPLYAHLARDPHPSRLMKERAWRVWRWVERMNAPVADTGEYLGCEPALVADDGVPDTLRALLAYVAEEYLTEITAQVQGVDAWLAEHPAVGEGEVIGGRPDRRFLGTITFDWRGHALTTSVVPYRVWVLQRLQDAVAAQTPDGRQASTDLLRSVGLQSLLSVRPRRRVDRADNREVWGTVQVPQT